MDGPRARPPVGGAAGGPLGVRVFGHPVSYEVAGEGGEPVVLVHGLSGSTRWWARNVSALAEHYRVYLVNLPGFGAARWRQRFVLSEAASWLLAWMEALGLEKVHLVGHSMGGYLSLKLATRRPGLVRKLVLVDPAGMPSGRSMLGHLGPLLLAARYGSPNFLPVLARDALYAGPLTLLRATRDLLAEDVSGDLAEVGMPTLLVWGERDPLIPPSVGDLMRAGIPGSRLLVIEGAGHNPMFDRPEAFNAALLAFLAGEPVGE